MRVPLGHSSMTPGIRCHRTCAVGPRALAPATQPPSRNAVLARTEDRAGQSSRSAGGRASQSGWLAIIGSKTNLRVRSSIVVVALLAACGAPHNHPEGASKAVAAVRGFPTFPGATWDGDITTQEEDGQLTWLVSWTAPSPESAVRRFFVRTLGQFGWQFGPSSSAHELALRREDMPLRGYLRFGHPELGKAGTGVTLGIRDPRQRKNGCLKALPWLPIYPGAEVRTCDLVHIPGARSLSVLAATSDDVGLANQTLGRALLAAGLTSQPPVIGALVFRHQSGAREMVRVIWGPDPTGHLPTAFMLSIDLPEAALTELPQ